MNRPLLDQRSDPSCWSEADVLKLISAKPSLSRRYGSLNGAQLLRAAKQDSELHSTLQDRLDEQRSTEFVRSSSFSSLSSLTDTVSPDADIEAPAVAPVQDDPDDDPPGGFPPLFAMPHPLFLVITVLIGVGMTLCCTVFKSQLTELSGGEEGWIGREDCPPGSDVENCFVETFLKFASIPIVAVPFTYAHIWLALWRVAAVPAVVVPYVPVPSPLPWESLS